MTLPLPAQRLALLARTCLLLGGLLLGSRQAFAQINYCTTGLGGSCGGSDISAVSLSGTTLNATGLTCASSGGQAYTSYPATGANTATLSGGVPYTLNVTLTGPSIVSVWVDYNRNFAYDANEWTQVAASSPTGTPATVSLLLVHLKKNLWKNTASLANAENVEA